MLFINYFLFTFLIKTILNIDNENFYCGEKDLKFDLPLKINFLKYNNKYGNDTLKCEYYIQNYGIPTKKIKIIIIKYYENINISFNIKYKNKNYEDIIETVTIENNTMIFESNYNKITYLKFLITTNQTYDSIPFTIELKNSINVKQLIIIVSIFSFFFILMVIGLIKYYCYVKNLNNIYENEEHLANKIEEDIKVKSCKLILKKIYDDEKYFTHDDYDKKYEKYGTICSICQENFKIKKDKISITPCEHIFHNDCLKKWFKKNILHPKCPNCNLNMLEVEKINENNVNIKVIQVKTKKRRLSNNVTSKNNLMSDEIETNNNLKTMKNNINNIENNINNNNNNINENKKSIENENNKNKEENNTIGNTKNINIKNKRNISINLNNYFDSTTDRALTQDNNFSRNIMNNNINNINLNN